MKLVRLHVGGFGRLIDRAFTFGPGLNVVVGPNESGKSTLAAAIVASLYGLSRGEKERFRPWSGETFATTLLYETGDGAAWEVQREFERDAKGVRIYDRDGNDASARAGEGKTLVPGEAHLGISADVFAQTACVRQRAVALEGSAADDVSAALARALGGGPREDAAIGALERLDAALRKHVGTQRATKNAPLRALRADEERRASAAAQAREKLDALAALRERVAAARTQHARDASLAATLARRVQSLKAAQLRARLSHLKDHHAELAALQASRAASDDVAAFPVERVAALDEAFHAWQFAEQLAVTAAQEAGAGTFDDAQAHELAERRADAGTLDESAYAALRAAAAQAEAARARVAAASGDAAAARRDGAGGRALAGAIVFAALIATIADVGVAVAHLWTWVAIATVIALVLAFAAFGRARSRSVRVREADAKQRIADAALAEERLAADMVARVLEPLGIVSVDDLVRRRERLGELEAVERDARRADEQARKARARAVAESDRFDGLAAELVPGVQGSREERRAAAHARAARRRERDGIEASLAMLTMRRTQILGNEDEYALQAELDALLAAGVEPAVDDDPAGLRRAEAECADLRARAHEAERLAAALEGELTAGEKDVPDVAALDEALAATRAQIARLEGFARAVELARGTIERHKEEAHRAFARRLEQYSDGVLREVTAGRYGEIRVDPRTLAIRARVPETRKIEDLDRLSAGTRDQIALIVRFASARMFAEGLETPPLLLDDPFAFWDTARIGRCVPILVRGAHDMQTILFTASSELAAAAENAGAARLDLSERVTV